MYMYFDRNPNKWTEYVSHIDFFYCYCCMSEVYEIANAPLTTSHHVKKPNDCVEQSVF